MKYFYTEDERARICVTACLEFQKEHAIANIEDNSVGYHAKDSVSLDLSLWHKFKLTDLFTKIIPDFDLYGIMYVDEEDWKRLLTYAAKKSVWRDVVADVTPWVEDTFKNGNAYFMIIGV